MRRTLLGACALFALLVHSPLAHAQQLLPTKGWGSLSGKATLDGAVPAVIDLTPKMMAHQDKACCLDPKAAPVEKVDPTWLVDPKTKGVANVVIWIKPPPKSYFPIHDKYKKRTDTVLLDQPHCAFLPRVAAFNPFYQDNGKEVETGQKLTIRNSAVVSHNVRATGHPDKNPGFNINMIPKTDLDATKKFVPQPLPISLNCDIHPWMGAKLFVFDHPYYAITKDDGTYEIPIVPAGAEVTVMGWHEGVGWTLTKAGHKLTIQEGKNTLDLQLKPGG